MSLGTTLNGLRTIPSPDARKCRTNLKEKRRLTPGLVGPMEMTARSGYLAAVGVAPLLFGGNVPLAWGLNALAMGAILVLFVAGHLIQANPLPVPLSWAAVPLALFALVILWTFGQSIPWMPGGWHHPIWRT